MPAAVEVMINADIYVGHTGGFGCSLDEYGNYRTSTDPGSLAYTAGDRLYL